ncbi:MAG: chemotaxis protein CheA [Dethiobacter sp.]|nr:chemotaxis protein CheA [Dethiobacter sp.]MCL5981449.1 chemotaxis protein CheA [Bacillota bacterium]
MDTSEYRDLFLAEAREYLQNLNTALLDLEHNPGSKETLQEMFRVAHSLKGMSATMGYNALASLTHQMENVLDLLRQGVIQVERPVANVLFESLDLLEMLLDRLDEPETYASQLEKIVCQLREVGCQPTNGQAEKTQAGLLAFDEFEKETIRDALAHGEQALVIGITLEQTCLLKSVRAYMVFKALEKTGHLVKSLPSLQELEEEKFENSFCVVLLTVVPVSVLQATLGQIAEVTAVSITAVAQELIMDSRLADLSSVALSDSAVTPDQAMDDPENGAERKRGFRRSQEKTVRVETDKLDKLINLVGELVVNRTSVVEQGKAGATTELNSAVEQLDRITTELQSAVMKLRMVPIKQVFDRLPRMVRDLSQEKGKKVNLEVRGEDTELDRSIVNQIGDPLVHLLRNAVDHGIESPAERVSAGKPEVSTIWLEARHEGSYVMIRVSDDGRGIDHSKVRAKAVQKGLLSTAEAQRLSDEEALRLIFRNGFSLAEQVTDISGRGVGMDAVKSAIESINGSTDIKTAVGKGTHFYIRLPLTLAIIKALLVQAAGEIYAIPIEAIRENLYVTPAETKTIQKGEVINLRNEVLPLIYLDEALGLPASVREEVLSVVVVEAADRKAGLVVDLLIGQQEIVIKSLSKVVEGIRGVAGATVLGNGKVALILDVFSLI